ncbi:MAG: hypothetical protein ISS78_04030 [Phycisphaerae bacterium]|nr:hypothetical protein [Phycisphaerae bacterium]
MMIRAAAKLGVFRAPPAPRKGPQALGPVGGPGARPGRGTGFSLTELLIAIGLVGVGMGMIAALFVTGLAQVGMSVGTSEGGMVAANGIAVARMLLTAGDVSDGEGNPLTELTVIADESHTTKIGAAFQKFPYADADTNKGFVILARQCGGGAYQLVSVAYAKAGTGAVTAQTVTSSQAYADATEITFTASTNLNVGSPVIIAASGQYATIVNLNGAVATLDHALTIGSDAAAYVIVESTGGSPVTSVHVTRTGLKP